MKIRRPLCAAGLVYAAAVSFFLLLSAHGAPTAESPDREHVTAVGFVEQIERRQSEGGTQIVLTLSDTAILEESQIPVLEKFLSDSEKISQYRRRQLWKEKKENFRRTDAAGVTGVLCYTDGKDIPRMGSMVTAEGNFRAFMHATNPGEFDAADYYRIMGQQGRIMDCRIMYESDAYDVFRDAMYRVREYLSLLADASFTERDASVVKAMLLGEKGTLDAGLKELYRQNGISHILAISGVKTLNLVAT